MLGDPEPRANESQLRAEVACGICDVYDNVFYHMAIAAGELMFGWLKGRRDRDQDFLDNFQRAAAKGESRARVNRALSSAGVQLAAEPDNAQFCIKASAAIVRVIVQRAGMSIREIDDETKFVAGIFGFVASDYLSRVVEAPFEIVSSIVLLELFGTEYAEHIGRVGDSYNRMAQSGQVIKTIGQNIADWISTPTDEQLEQLADLFRLCRKYA